MRAAFSRFQLEKPCSLWLPGYLFSAVSFLASRQLGILCVWTSCRDRDLLLLLVLLPAAWPMSSAEPVSQGNLKSHQVPKPPSQQLLGASPAPQPHGLFQVPGPFSATSAYMPFTSRTQGSCAWQVYACVHAKSLELHPTLCDPMDYSLPGSSVHGFLQARIQEGVAMPSSKGSSKPRNRTHISCGSCIAGGFFYCWATREAPGRSIFSSVSGPSTQARPMTLPPGRRSHGFPFWPASFRGPAPSFPRKESKAPGDQSPGHHLISRRLWPREASHPTHHPWLPATSSAPQPRAVVGLGSDTVISAGGPAGAQRAAKSGQNV